MNELAKSESAAFQRRREDAQEAGQEAAQRVPVIGDWGYCNYGDAPPYVCGAGIPFFSWFASQADMVEYLRAHSTYEYPTFGETPHEEMERQVAALFASAISDFDALREALNNFLSGAVHYQRIGSFETLMKGPGAFPEKIRAEFRGEDEKEGGGAPLDDAEVADLAQFTRDYAC